MSAPQALQTDGTLATTLVRLLLVAVTYYVAGRLGLLIPYVGSHISLVWLPSGIALAAIRRWGQPMALAIALGAFCVNYRVGGPGWMAAWIAIGNAAGPWLTTRLLRRWDFDESFSRSRDLRLLFAAVAVGMLVTSTNGVLWLGTAGLLPAGQPASAWATWWAGDAVGAIVAGIPLLVLRKDRLRESFLGGGGAANLGLVAVALACAMLVFLASASVPGVAFVPLLCVPTLAIALLALRGGILAASVTALCVSMVIAWGTAQGVGPFVATTPHAGLVALWAYLTVQTGACTLVSLLATESSASRRQLAALFAHAGAGMLRMTADGRLLQINPEAARQLGVRSERLLPMRLAELPMGNGVALERWLRDGQPAGAISAPLLRVTGADGREREVEAERTEFRDGGGRIQIVAVLRDVTERRRAQTRLAISEERLRAISDNAPALIAEFDSSLRFRFANERYHEWMGLNPGSLVGLTIAEALGEDVFARLRPHFDAVLRGEATNYEREIVAPGGRRWIHVTIFPCRDASGCVTSFFVLGLDVTKRILADQAREEGEQRLRTITDQLPIRVSYVDSEERYQFLNRAYESAFATPRRAILGKTIREVIGEAAYAQIRHHIRRALAGEAVTFESELSLPSGYRCYSATYLPQFSAGDRHVVGFVAMITDRTAEKLEERRLIRLSQMDSLTGLLNRAGFDDRYAQAFERARRSHSAFALLIIDLDGFKQINDQFGHLSGDLILQGFSSRISHVLRAGDAVARLGGDEFAVLLEDAPGAAESEAIAIKLVEAARPGFVFSEATVYVTASVGIVHYAGDPTLSPRDVMKLADDAMYAAKAGGRDGARMAAACA